MDTQLIEGDDVLFKPSERTLKKFKNKQKATYPAKITEVNADSVDLTVFGVGEIVFVSNVKRSGLEDENHSSWDWPRQQ